MKQEDRIESFVYMMNDVSKNKDIINGYFWNDDIKHSFYSMLSSYHPMRDCPYGTSVGVSYTNFSLINPNNAKYISTQEDVEDWVEKNPMSIVLIDDELSFSKDMNTDIWYSYIVMIQADGANQKWERFKAIRVV